jgi:hypothetical protein
VSLRGAVVPVRHHDRAFDMGPMGEALVGGGKCEEMLLLYRVNAVGPCCRRVGSHPLVHPTDRHGDSLIRRVAVGYLASMHAWSYPIEGLYTVEVVCGHVPGRGLKLHCLEGPLAMHPGQCMHRLSTNDALTLHKLLVSHDSGN